MLLEMRVPSPGEAILEVEIAQWLVENGDRVEKDQAIAEVDSDKATLELPAEAGGIITLKADEGDAVPVGSVVCLIETDEVEAKTKTKIETTQATYDTFRFQKDCPTCGKIMTHYSGQDVYVCCDHWLNGEKVRNGEL